MRTILIVALLSGCAISDDLGSRVGAGSAKYTYTRTLTDGSKCQVNILSARDVIGGSLNIGPDCSITSAAQQTQGVDKAMQAVDTALELAKTIATKVP